MRLHHQLLLFPHATTSPQGFALHVRLKPTSESLAIVYELSGPREALKIPAHAAEPAFRDELWKSTCFEIFLHWDGSSAYEEWNFSPSGDWAHYGFSRYRERESGFEPAPPRLPIAWQEEADALRLEVAIPWPRLREKAPRPHVLRYGLSSVLELKHEPEHQYWAAHHAAAKPDFHDPHSFIGELLEDFRGG